MKSKVLRLPCIAVCLFLVQSIAAVAQTIAPATLPPAAQEALNKGIIAAKVPDYLLAIRFFEEARKLAPQAPIIHLNLGLAESRVPNRELRAMAWFGAYLVANPDAPNAVAVKEQIAILDIRSQSTVSRVIRAVQEAAGQVPDLDNRRHRSESLMMVADLWLESGDMANAQRAAELIRYAHFQSLALINIAEAKARAGDSAGAKDTFLSALNIAERIAREPTFGIESPPTTKSRRQAHIAAAQATSGDIAGAIRTANLIDDTYGYKSYAQRDIAAVQATSGDIGGALKTVELIRLPAVKDQAKGLIAKAPDSTRQSPSGTQAPIQSAISVSDWLKKLDDRDQSGDCALNTEPFLDLAGYLQALPASNDLQKVFQSLHKTAKTMLSAQKVVTSMLNPQAKR